jgi:hypothetical protein
MGGYTDHMTLVRAKVRLSPKFRSYEFGDGWDFEIGGFKFQKEEDGNLYASYEFEFEIEKDDPDFGRVLSGPHEGDTELLEKEYELETLLDVIAIETGEGLRIETDTYSYAWGNYTETSTSNNTLPFNGNTESIGERYGNVLKADESLQDALRFYRLNTLDDDLGERAMQLWTVIERLYGKQPDEKYLSKEEVATIIECIGKSDIPEEKHEKIRTALHFINPVSTLDLLADRIKLKSREGPMSESDLKDLLGYWKSLRGSQGHGRYLLRSENLEYDIWDIEDTVELFLENKISPKLYHVYVFKDSSLSEDWKKSPSLEKVGDWNTVPSRGANMQSLARVIQPSIRDNEQVFVFDYSKVLCITREGGYVAVQLDELDDALRAIVVDEQKRMIG